MSPAGPMLAVLSDRRDFGGEVWLFERKLDGVRALARRDGDRVRLFSRTGQPLDATYPEIIDALAAQPCHDFEVDGEVVAMEAGRTSFTRLQRRIQIGDAKAARASGVRVDFYLFDVLRLDGRDTTALPLRERKRLLRGALRFGRPLRFTPHRNAGGQELLDKVCGSGWEGLIAKRADSRYVRRRSTDWLKLKCSAGQEMVIAGFTDPAGTRTGFGALLLGYYEGGRLRYAGRVGTGFDNATLRRLRSRLDALEQDRPTFAAPEELPAAERSAHWVRAELVAQVEFTEWTRDGRLRHPRFLGLREDKRAKDVVRE
ncbi:non-homologous end-joining DNA ligase [Streptomyces sp. NPDC052236]|uniref:non-homologous end-joining DNA ligase n=1 Tax=Streptomyces sp. NPDC052236 TaxID=3365686 RepID=UPI0037D23DD0